MAIRDKFELKLIFRRFSNESEKAGYLIVDDQEIDLVELFSRGEFSEVFITKNLVPDHPQDWKFMQRAAEQIILISGNLVRGKQLEVGTIRVLSKSSTVNDVFKQIKKTLNSICEKGVTTTTGVIYKDILHSRKMKAYGLKGKIGSSKIKYEA